MKTILRFTAPVTLALMAALSAQYAGAGTTYYRWVDARGDTVLSDRPPPSGTQYEVVSTGTTLKRVVEPEEGAVPAEVKPSEGNKFEQVDTAEARESSKTNPEYCKQAQQNLETLTTRPRIRMRDENGELRYLTQEEIEEQKEEAQEAIDTYC